MPGPPPTPTKLKLLRGNPGKRPIKTDEPQPTPIASPKCPRHLRGVARTEWNRVVPELFRLGLVSVVDQSVLESYCVEVKRYRDACEFIDKNGQTYITRDRDGAVKSVCMFPQVGIARASIESMRKLAAEFGFTPAARVRLSAPAKPGSQKVNDDDFRHKRASKG